MEALPKDIEQALERIRAWDPSTAERLGQAFERVLRAADALSWARDRLPALLHAGGETALLDAVVEEAVALTHAPEVWALTWSGSPTRPSFRALAGRGAVGRTEDGEPVTPDTLSRSILGQVVREGRPAWSDDAVADARFLGAESVQGLRIRSVGCLPIGQAGVLYLCDPETPGRFGPAARARLSALCATAALLLPSGEPAPRRRVEVEPLPGLAGEAPAMLELAAAVRAFAPMPWPVLILGETGTGKEAVARAIHELSPRRRLPFVAVNCAAIPDDLAESTLFGHERGAFTGADRRREGLVERAAEGTLFLDEVGELSPRVQPKLLRLLQEGRYERLGDEREREFRGRIVAATHRPIAGGGAFREDLFHRLSACVVRVPPVRERPGDVPHLARELLRRALAEIPGAPRLELDPAALAALEARPWPGNVRELQNAIRGAVARALAERAERIRADHLAPAAPGAARATDGEEVTDLLAATEAFQRAKVRAALAACGGNRTQAAERLGVSRQWLHKLLARWEAGTPG